MTKTLLLLPLLAFSASIARAADAKKTCSDVDLRSEFGAVRQQGSTGWCYAFSYADLVGHALKIKPPDMVSAMDVAVSVVTPQRVSDFPRELRTAIKQLNKHFQGQRLDERGGGDFDEVADMYRFRGRLCLETQIPSEGLVAPAAGIEAFTEPMDHPKEDFISQRINDFYMKRGFGKNTKLHLNPAEEDDENGLNSPSNPISELCKPQPPFSFQEVDPRKSLRARINDWAASAIRDEHDKICAKDPRLENIEPEIVYREGRTGTKQLQASADKLLSKKTPFMIGYEPCALLKKEEGQGPNCMGHASSVIGRRWNDKTKTCEYLVRNSWGRDCSIYREGIECDGGNFWASGKELFGSTAQIMSLKKSK